MGPILTLTTDFGPTEYVAAMKGVVLSINPDIRIVDVEHHVRPQDILHGAYVLYAAAPHFPFAAHLAVVDPGVGTARRGLVVVCEGALFVGPDNGILIPAASRMGIKEVRAIENRELFRKEVSSTFHGRDVFAPVAAHLLSGTKVREVGPAVKDCGDLDFGAPRKRGAGLEGRVIAADRFGNVITNLTQKDAEGPPDLGKRLSVTLGGYEMTAPFVGTYADVARGDYLVTISSSGFVEVARRDGDAAASLNVSPGMAVTVRKA